MINDCWYISYGYQYLDPYTTNKNSVTTIWNWMKLSQIKRPSGTGFIADAPSYMFACYPVPAAGFGTLHNGGGNLLFFDGHVSWLPYAEGETGYYGANGNTPPWANGGLWDRWH